MDPTLRQIRSFIVLAKEGSFTRAAEQLSISQPALTVQIRQLEETLGVSLFDRNTRAVRMTRVGAELVPQFERVSDEFEGIVVSAQDLASGRRGVVRLAVLPSFASGTLPDAILAFRAQRPNVAFVVRDVSWSRVIALVQAGEVDFGVGDEARGSGLTFTPFRRDPMQVIYPVGHPIAKLKKVVLARLAEYPLVMMAPETSARGMIDAAFAAIGRSPERACEVALMSSAVAMVRAGLGIAILPANAVDWRAHPGLEARIVYDRSFVRTLGVVTPAGRTLPPASAAFAHWLMLAPAASDDVSNRKPPRV